MDNDLSSEYWNKRYLSNEAGWDLGQISTPLKSYFDQLQNKNAFILIPGAGNAYEAEYLFNNGFKQVYVCDLAAEPLLNLKQRCPSFNSQHLLQQDFSKLKDLNFDLIVEQTFFCALNPALCAAYFKKAAELLKPGGKLAGVLFDDVLNSDKPPFGGNRQEYVSYIKPPLLIKTLEPCYNSIKPRQGRELFINLVKDHH
ncbi:MAG TPA: methyltransferase domain-containing protein [Bacteroidia bacterium]|nr:methyltransferase domain-containing protein [Bacteroidia bacterium]